MSHYQFLQTYLGLLEKLTSQTLYDLDFTLIEYSKEETSPYWNLALTNTVLTTEQLKEIEDKFLELERTPAVYFENREDLLDLKTFLANSEYKQTWEDSWMFYEKELPGGEFDLVKKVETEKDFETWLDLFNRCYQKDDPQNPYGELGDYLVTFKSSWEAHHRDGSVECFLAYDNDQPVAVATLNSYEGLGYISNVGSLRSVRGKGFGKLVTLAAVNSSQKHGNKLHCLATEDGTYPNEFYKRIGFETKFTAVGYTK